MFELNLGECILYGRPWSHPSQSMMRPNIRGGTPLTVHSALSFVWVDWKTGDFIWVDWGTGDHCMERITLQTEYNPYTSRLLGIQWCEWQACQIVYLYKIIIIVSSTCMLNNIVVFHLRSLSWILPVSSLFLLPNCTMVSDSETKLIPFLLLSAHFTLVECMGVVPAAARYPWNIVGSKAYNCIWKHINEQGWCTRRIYTHLHTFATKYNYVYILIVKSIPFVLCV